MLGIASVKDIVRILGGFAPFDTAEPWDNVGLLVGRRNAPVERVLLALDVTMDVIREAVAQNVQLIVTHHPLMFHARSRMTDEDPEGQMLLALCENGIALCSLHTNLDKAAGGVNDALMRAVGFEEADGEGFLRTADLPEETTLDALTARIDEGLGTRSKVYGRQEEPLRRLACCSGAGGGEIDAAIAAGADVFLTGEIKHHEALYAMHRGICVVESGHFETERPVLESLCEALQKACDAVQYNISVFCSRVNPF